MSSLFANYLSTTKVYTILISSLFLRNLFSVCACVSINQRQNPLFSINLAQDEIEPFKDIVSV